MVHKKIFEEDPIYQNRENLHLVQADLSNYLRLEEDFWRQKSRLVRFQNGESNTKKFHSYLKDRRRKLQIKRIHNEEGD